MGFANHPFGAMRQDRASGILMFLNAFDCNLCVYSR
jgi:hypothetical protein